MKCNKQSLFRFQGNRYGSLFETLGTKRFILEAYEPNHFRADWSKVGVFRVAGIQQGRDKETLLHKEKVCGKGVLNNDTVIVYTRDMWLV